MIIKHQLYLLAKYLLNLIFLRFVLCALKIYICYAFLGVGIYNMNCSFDNKFENLKCSFLWFDLANHNNPKAMQIKQDVNILQSSTISPYLSSQYICLINKSIYDCHSVEFSNFIRLGLVL